MFARARAGFSRLGPRRATRGKVRAAAAIVAAATGALGIAAAPLPSAAAAYTPMAAESDTVPVTFRVVHIRTGAPLIGWIVKAIHIGSVDPFWEGRTGNNGSVTLDLIEGPYEVLVYRDHPVWVTYIEVETASEDGQAVLVFTIPVDPELG